MKKLLIGTLSLAVSLSLNAKVLATVDGSSITDKDMNALMQQMGARTTFDKLPKQMQQKSIDQAIDRVLLLNAAQKSGIEKTKEYKDELKKIEKSLALDVWMKKQFNDVKVSSAQAKKFYNDNKTKFMQPKRVKARHILLKTKKEAQDVIKALKGLSGKKLEDKFISLAKTKSVGPSAKSGGELNWFTKQQMVKEFSDAAFKLKTGHITTTPVKSQFGYHVILKQDQKAASTVEFSKVEPQIVNNLKMQEFKEDIMKKTSALRKKAKISIK